MVAIHSMTYASAFQLFPFVLFLLSHWAFYGTSECEDDDRYVELVSMSVFEPILMLYLFLLVSCFTSTLFVCGSILTPYLMSLAQGVHLCIFLKHTAM